MDLGAGATQRNGGKVVLLAPALFLVLAGIFLGNKSTKYVSAEQQEASIIINEIMYDPEGTDSGHEWIELKNVCDEPRTLTGWEIQIAGSSFTTKVNLSSLTIWPGEIALIGESDVPDSDVINPLSMQNSGSATDGVRILNQNDEIIDTVLYGTPNSNELLDDNSNPTEATAPDVKPGHSLARISDEDTDDSSIDFVEAVVPTPGEENVFAPQASIIVSESIFILQPIIIDGSDSIDIDGEIETYSWEILENEESIAEFTGEKVEYTFESEGEYTINLEIEDDDGLTHSISMDITATQDPENPIITSVSDTKLLDENTNVSIEATITAPPGTLYEKEAYAQDATAGIRLKVPDDIALQQNKTYILTGKTGTTYGEFRVEVDSILPSQKNILIRPIELSSKDIDETLIGSLISTQIIITKRRDRYLYSEENGQGITPTIYIPETIGIEIPENIKGQTVQITGILSRYGTNQDGTPKVRIMPLSSDQFSVTSSVQGLASTGYPAIPAIIPFILAISCSLHRKKHS